MLGRPTLTHSLSNSLEACVIDAANPVVVRQHMLCAAAEQPLGGQLVDDALLFGGQQAFDEAVRALCAEEKLVLLPGGPHHAPSWRADVLNGTAAELCNIRSIERHKVQVLLRRRVRSAQPTLAQCAARGGGEAARSGRGASSGGEAGQCA